MRVKLKNRTGSILILALWTMMFLTIIAVNIGLRVRQRVALIGRIEEHSQLHLIAHAGVKVAIASLRQDAQNVGQLYTVDSKKLRHNNPETYKEIPLGAGFSSVFFYETSSRIHPAPKRYGFLDEESKININVAERAVLLRLFNLILGGSEEDNERLADALIDWRDFGRSQISGFYSDEYYAALKFPYEPKNANFELIDELLLVQGFHEGIVGQLSRYITVYGDGRININTAPREVLIALGLSEYLADKIVSVRRGVDDQEATGDDYIFVKTFDIASEIRAIVELDANEVKQIDALNSLGYFKTFSSFFNIHSEASLKGASDKLEIACIYNLYENKIQYWREK